MWKMEPMFLKGLKGFDQIIQKYSIPSRLEFITRLITYYLLLLTYYLLKALGSGGGKGGEVGHAPRAALCRGRHLEGNSEIWPLFWQISVLFTVHTNAIVVPIRISIADLTRGGGNTDVCPGWQKPSRRHWPWGQGHYKFKYLSELLRRGRHPRRHLGVSFSLFSVKISIFTARCTMCIVQYCDSKSSFRLSVCPKRWFTVGE